MRRCKLSLNSIAARRTLKRWSCYANRASAARSGSSTYWMQLDSKMVVKRRILIQGMSDINNIARAWELPSFS